MVSDDIRYMVKLMDWAAGEGFCRIDGMPDPDVTCAAMWERFDPEGGKGDYSPDKLADLMLTAWNTRPTLTAQAQADAAEIERLREAAANLLNACYAADAAEELPEQICPSLLDNLREALELHYPVIWTPEQVAMLEARQNDLGQHPYTCGGDRSDEAHRQIADEDCHRDTGLLYPTVRGWKCPACDYRQFWAHEIPTALGEQP